jgi:phage baseplate assembly protein W
MALKIRRKPSDVVWSDISSDFNLDAQGNIKIVNNVDSVVTSMTNIISTFSGERPMLLDFGSDIKDLLFQNIDKEMMDFLATKIRDVIEAWDNRVKIVEINTTADPDRATVTMNISFQVRSYQGVFEFSTQLK